MDKIEVEILNPDAITNATMMMGLSARITQRGHAVKNMDDLIELYNKPISSEFIKNLTYLPHPTLQKFGIINIAITGASRRFLAQITRHQNEVKFMSASLQYSDYSHEADFTVPYELIGKPQLHNEYISKCKEDLNEYERLIANGVDHDAAAYIMPQGLRNILIISATPYQWKHMIHQRACRRNTNETRYVMLLVWEKLYKLCPELFSPETTGPFCQQGSCKEGKMCCGKNIDLVYTPTDILNIDFEKIRRTENEN